ncbi:MAG: OB-fold domain-containing protein, partial [Trebonia sp.]
EPVTPDTIRAAAERIAAVGDSRPRLARDPVNLPMIRNWLEAIGAPGDLGGQEGGRQGREYPDTAPPAMIQVWTMPGLHGARGGDDPLAAMTALLDEAGYTSVVATNCDQVYYRPLRLGERLAVQARLVDVTGPKRTALGDGWFVTTRSTWTSAGEPVATMDFRVLKFKPAPRKLPQGDATPSAPSGVPRPEVSRPEVSRPGVSRPEDSRPEVIRPVVSPDTAFFWAGTAAGELRVQRCDGCGTLRHPPGPMCPSCGTMTAGSMTSGNTTSGNTTSGYVVAAGAGEIYSYVVHHHPPVPGKKLPIVIALVQLPEGVRMVGELLGADPGQAQIGLPVRAEFVRIDDELTLPAWRATSDAVLPPLVIDVTPTFVISSALATRDFQDVHHDRDRAIAGGARDIFLNILTTTGLVQRYVADWAGPDAIFRAISVRLGVPCHAGDTLTLTGKVTTDKSPADGGAERVISVVGRCRLGDHVTATVRLAPAGER